MAHEVFISYSHKDKTVADAICNRLEADGIRCWYAPRDIEPGTEWGVEILKGIERAKVMVLVFTKDANLSQQVLREVNNAVNYGLSIIPFRLTEEEPAAGMKYYLSTVHWMDAMNTELDDSICTLSDLCKAVLEKKPVPSTSDPVALSKKTASASGKAAASGVPKRRKVFSIILLSLVALIAVVVIGIASWFVKMTRDIDDPAYSAVSETSVEDTAGEDENAAEESNAESSADDAGESVKIEHEKKNYESLGAISENVSTDLSETYTRGNNQSNLQNGGYLAYDGEYYYYASNDGMKMFRMKEDGSDKKQLTDSGVRAISVIDGYIYFVLEGEGYYKMKNDGTEMELITDEYDATSRIVGDRIYSCEYGISSVALDGGDYVQTVEETGYYTVLDGTYAYYSNPADSGRLYRCRMDGTNHECIYDHYVLSLRIAGNYLFFYDSDDGYEMSYDLTTGETTQLFADPANDPVVTEDGIYGPSGQMVLTYKPFSGMGMKVYSDEWVSVVNVAGNKVFYHNDDDDKYYLVDLDGSNLTET